MNNYNQYLYFVPRYLNEENLYVLNEMYFGKTPRIKLLEKLCKVWLDSFYNPGKKIDLSPFYRVINKSEKYLKIKNDKTFINNINDQDIEHDREEYNNFLQYECTNIQKEIIYLFEELISIIFGIKEVQVLVTTDINKKDYGMAMLSSIFINTKIQNGKVIFKDNDGKDISLDYIKDNIIVKNTGISINSQKCKLNLILSIPSHYIKLTAPMMTASILHEIGHFFSYFILSGYKYLLPSLFEITKNTKKYLTNKQIDQCFKIIQDNKELFNITDKEIGDIKNDIPKQKETNLLLISDRINEKFADQFVSLYGYGLELGRFFSDVIIDDKNKIYDYYGNKKFELSKGANAYMTNAYINKFSGDCHPEDIKRIESQILQLQAEKNNPRLSYYKKQQIENDIKNIRKYLHNIKFNNISDDVVKQYSDEEVLDIILAEYKSELSKLKNDEQKILSTKIMTRMKQRNLKSLQARIDKMEEKIILLQTDKKEQKIEIQNWREKQNLLLKTRYNNYPNIRVIKSKGRSENLYNKDSYVDPYDISNELNRLYDKTKQKKN